MRCPNCNAKISAKDYDPEYEWYECSKCDGAFTVEEIERARVGQVKAVVAKGKIRRTEIAEDEAALAEHEAESLKPKKASREVHHRDEISFGQVVEIMGDEIEAICEETGIPIDRLNAREFFAVNIWRDLSVTGHVRAREKSVPMVLCKEHDGGDE